MFIITHSVYLPQLINLLSFVPSSDNMINLSGVYSKITCQIKKPVYLTHSKNGEKVRKEPRLFKFKSQPFYQGYKSNLPTSLTHITLYNYKLLASGTCCGILYGSRI